MSISWWAEAAHASNYIYNRFPHCALGCTPFELWYGHKHNLANLHVWGCLAYVHLQKDQREEPKHRAHTRLCTFIAYRDDYKGWEFLDHETSSRVSHSGRRVHSDIRPGFLGLSSILCCSLLQRMMHLLQ